MFSITIAVWFLWKIRDSSSYEHKCHTPMSSVRKIEALSSSLAPQTAHVAPRSGQKRPPPRWSPPSLSVIKVNVDGALRKQANMRVVGAVFRDSQESPIEASSLGYSFARADSLSAKRHQFFGDFMRLCQWVFTPLPYS